MITGAFSRGELSYSKVRPLTRVATERTEADLIELARHATAAQLERMLSGYERVRARRRTPPRRSARSGGIGTRTAPWCSAAGCPPRRDGVPAGSRDLAVTDSCGSACGSSRNDGSAEPRAEADPPLVDSPPTNADALCRDRRVLPGPRPDPVKGAERHHVIVHIEAEALSRDGPGRSRLADGPAIAPEVARRLGCDASLLGDRQAGAQGALGGEEDESDPGGDRSRPARARSTDAAFPAASEPLRRRHYVRHWAHGGRDVARQSRPALPPSPSPRPRGRVLGTTRASRAGVPRSAGRPAGSAPRHYRRADHADLRRRNRLAGLEIAADTLLTGTGEKMHLPSAVDAVLAICDGAQS